MRIGIDARFYGPTGKGLGRYTQEIVDNVIKIVNADNVSSSEHKTSVSFSREEIEIVVFLSAENFNDFITPASNVKKVLLRVNWYSWQEQILMPFVIKKEKVDLMHYPHFNVPMIIPGKFVVTIHDLILTHFPTRRASTLSPLLYYFKNIAYRLVIKCAIRRASRIITVSEFTKKDLMKKFSVAAEKISVTYEGVANLTKAKEYLSLTTENEFNNLYQYNIFGSDFLLYVGNAYPHKNLEFLLKSFKKMLYDYPNLRLVLVGKEDYFYKRLSQLAVAMNLWRINDQSSPVIFAGYVPDAQLQSLYNKAKTYVFPSKYEGFGLPPLEAMSQGCPVVSSNRGSLPEILGLAAKYFNPDDEQDFINCVKEVTNNNDLRLDLISRGLTQAAKYSWESCAQETFDIYTSVIHE